MFEIEAEVGASVLVFVVCVVAWHFVLLTFGEFFAEACGEDVFATEFDADGCLAEGPCGVGSCVGSVDVGLVEVLIGFGVGSHPDVVVEGAVPVELYGDVDLTFVFGAGADEVASVFFIL